MSTEGGYQLDLLIEHPSIAPSAITAALGLTPKYASQRGEPRRTSKGVALPGVWPANTWRHVRPFVRKRLFFRGVKAMLAKLDRHAAFLSEIVTDGGRITVVVNLTGYVNIGDVLDADSAALLAKLRIDLGVEVFPTPQVRWSRRG